MGLLDKLFGKRKETRQPLPMPSQEEPLPEPPPNEGEGAREEMIVREEPSPLPTPSPAGPPEEPLGSLPVSDRLRRRLRTYFTRLWEIYPDGVVERLNTHHKKLAERGGELRRLTGFEGNLDDFFALGGLIYRRTPAGRPRHLVDGEQLLDALRINFPDGVPDLLSVKERDHRLYLDLRTAARREQTTVARYLAERGLLARQKKSEI